MATIEDSGTVSRLLHLSATIGVLTMIGFTTLFFAFGQALAGWSTLAVVMTAVVVWPLVMWRTTGAMRAAVTVYALVTMANHVTVHVVLGGFARSGGYLFGGLVMTLMLSLVLTRTATLLVAGGYGALAVVLGLNEAALSASRPAPPGALSTVLFVTVLVASLGMLVPMFGYFLQRLAAERVRSEALLLNVLPGTIARRLKHESGMIADRHEECSVVFADLVDFTRHAKGRDPERIVRELNAIFSRFDELADAHRAEKIKTIGDGYMAACGLPDPDADHLTHACDLALDLVAAMPALNAELGTDLALRVGLNSGSAVAGIVGTSTFSYDVWGETVNIASRLESNGTPGAVVTSSAVAATLRDRYDLQPLGVRELKGEGPTELFAVVGPRGGRSASSGGPHTSR